MVEFFARTILRQNPKIPYYVSSISISAFCSILRTQTQILSNSRHHDMCVVNHLVIKGSELTVWFQVTEIRSGA